MTNGNVGHGHVHPRPDGMKARCGGPGLCSECSKDFAREHLQPPDPRDAKIAELWVTLEQERTRAELAEARLAKQTDYSCVLQRVVEALANGRPLPPKELSPHVIELAEKVAQRAEAAEAKLEAKDEELDLLRRVIQRAKIPLEEMAKSIPEPKPERHVLAHDRPGDGKQCVYLAIDVCNKCGWVRQYAEPKPEKPCHVIYRGRYQCSLMAGHEGMHNGGGYLWDNHCEPAKPDAERAFFGPAYVVADAERREEAATRSHELKCWPKYFAALLTGRKTFEARKNDRDFQVDDLVVLREWDEYATEYTGRTIRRRVSYLLVGPAFGVEEGWCVMALDSGDALRERVKELEESNALLRAGSDHLYHQRAAANALLRRIVENGDSACGARGLLSDIHKHLEGA
jgi:hypothetical protein